MASRRSQRQAALPVFEDEFQTTTEEPNLVMEARGGEEKGIVVNFVVASIIFSASPSCAIACLNLASARLGSVGAWQSGVLFLSYTSSSLLGATYVVKKLGSRNAMVAGMAIVCFYVGCFWVATNWVSIQTTAALVGATLGGIGSGFLWTAQGAYFTQAAAEFAKLTGRGNDEATSLFGGIFAACFLVEEAFLSVLSTVLVEFGMRWIHVFAIYAIVAVLSTLAMCSVRDYGASQTRQGDQYYASALYKMTAAWNLLTTDPKMKYLIGWNAAFGFALAFVNSFVSGQVLRVALHETESQYVGVFSALAAGVAAMMSLVYSRITQQWGKDPVMIVGVMGFVGVSAPFIVQPNLHAWTWKGLALIYISLGCGRACFESTLKATFADYFSYEKEGAFANIILQNGLASFVGFVLSAYLPCSTPGRYCVAFEDGVLHNVLIFEIIVVVTSFVAALGFWRASTLFARTGVPVASVGD